MCKISCTYVYSLPVHFAKNSKLNNTILQFVFETGTPITLKFSKCFEVTITIEHQENLSTHSHKNFDDVTQSKSHVKPIS